MTVFFDTGVLYSIFDRSDEHHRDAISLTLHALKGKWGRIYTSNYVEVEATLLLGSRLGPFVARRLSGFMARSGLKELVVDEDIHRRAVELFQSDESVSLTDAATVLLMKALGFRKLATFDGRTFSQKPVDTVGRNYWQSLTDEERGEVTEFESNTHGVSSGTPAPPKR